MSQSAPIRDHELEGLLAPLAAKLPLALAVSGGPDSMALMQLVARWAAQTGLPGDNFPAGVPAIIVLTVDHGLRPGAADEAVWVKRQSDALGFAHETLVWQGDKPKTGIQAAARAARYRLIGDFIRLRSPPGDHNACHTRARLRALVTAHHRDDQAETLLMRLARGSGVDGLAGMAGCSTLEGITILRPLLGVPKARLVATLEAAGQEWCSDPGNEQYRFERVRWRAARQAMEAAGLSNDMLALSAARLDRARAALRSATLDLAARAGLDDHDFSYATADPAVLAAAPQELRIRVMMRLLSVYGGQRDPPSLAKVEVLSDRLATGDVVDATLAGCHVSARAGRLIVCREWGRGGLPELVLAPGETACWDRRFNVCVSPDVAGRLHIAALGGDWAQLRRQFQTVAGCGIPARAARTLPAFRSAGEIIAVPHLGKYEPALLGPVADGIALLQVQVPLKFAQCER